MAILYFSFGVLNFIPFYYTGKGTYNGLHGTGLDQLKLVYSSSFLQDISLKRIAKHNKIKTTNKKENFCKDGDDGHKDFICLFEMCEGACCSNAKQISLI